MRLADVLDYLSKSKVKDCLALKGGTAINLFLLNLPRLSVDADFDFTLECSRKEMLEKRALVKQIITDYSLLSHYSINRKTKSAVSLDSFVFNYQTLSSSQDVLKIEINYSDRVHVLDMVTCTPSTPLIHNLNIRRLSDDELIGSKINALLVRTTPRDVYDVYNLSKDGKILEDELIRKIAIFYVALGSALPLDLDSLFHQAAEKMRRMDYSKIRATLIPVVRKGEKIDIEEMIDKTSQCLNWVVHLSKEEEEFVEEVNRGNFHQSLLFSGFPVHNLSTHPMLLWKLKSQKGNEGQILSTGNISSKK